MRGYEKLKVYEKSYKAALSMYRLVKKFPREERYSMTDQIKRASLSIPLNIAEGYAKRESQKEFKRFLMMALGSNDEVRVLINFARDLGYIDKSESEKALEEYEMIGKMLTNLIKEVRKNENPESSV